MSRPSPIQNGPQRSIMVRLTVPRFTGPAAFAVKLVLGLSDIGSLFARGRVGDVVKDDLHESFDVELEPDTGVGGDTSAGPIELMNDGGMLRLTVPGIWFSWVSNPILQFLLLRWFYRLVIWARFLWQVSRIKLDLIPTHPDRNGGLGFLAGSAHAYSPLLASFSAMVAGLVASRIFFQGASLADFKLEIISLVAFGMVLVLGPLTVFAPQILATKRRGKREYGALAATYTREFDRRWIRRANHEGESLLGTSDIQSLADLDNSYSIIQEMKAVPFNRDLLLQLVCATLAPFAPLVLTMIPLEELLDRIIKTVF